jgi:hypothetical protein
MRELSVTEQRYQAVTDAMRSRLAVVILALGVGLTGCSVEPPTEAELVGTWVHGDTVLALLEDGTFTLTDAPDYTLFTVSESWRDSAGETRDAFGEWSVEPDAVRLDNRAGSE